MLMDERLQLLTLAAIEGDLHAAVTELELVPHSAELHARVESLRQLRLQAIRGESL